MITLFKVMHKIKHGRTSVLAPLFVNDAFPFYTTTLLWKLLWSLNDYLTHLHHLRDKRALILLMVDVIDFPASLFPELKTLIHPANPVMIVANKTDLLPKNLQPELWKHFETMIVKECQRSSLAGCKISGVQFTRC